MTDASQIEVAAGEQWTRRKAVVIVTAAWAALGTLSVLVTACSIFVTILLFGDGASEDPSFLGIAVPLCLIILIWLVILWLAAKTQPATEDATDYAEIRVRPVVPILVVLAVTTSGTTIMALHFGVYGYVAISGLLPMVFSASILDLRLGPQVKRRCPELWAEAVKQWESRNRDMVVMGQAIAAVIVIPPVLLIVFIIANAIFGD